MERRGVGIGVVDRQQRISHRKHLLAACDQADHDDLAKLAASFLYPRNEESKRLCRWHIGSEQLVVLPSAPINRVRGCNRHWTNYRS
jgi:hypothetical protein